MQTRGDWREMPEALGKTTITKTLNSMSRKITIQNKKKILCPSTNYKQNQNISIYMEYG